MQIEPTNMELMQTLDDAWNAQDWDTFEKRHKPDTVVAESAATSHVRVLWRDQGGVRQSG